MNDRENPSSPLSPATPPEQSPPEQSPPEQGTPEPSRAEPSRPEPSPSEDPAVEAADAEREPELAGHVLLVRRRRGPALGFWVLLAFVVAGLGGMVTGWVVGVRSLAQLLYFAVTAMVFVGAPLAFLAAVVDAVRSRASRRH